MATAAGVWKCEDEDNLYTDDVQQPLEEFVRCSSLPQCVSVTQGSFMSPGAMIARGDVLVLRGLAPSTVTLTFADKSSDFKREMVVSPDIPYKFLVMPPKDSCPEEAAVIGRPVSMVTYPTVADLLLDCPTYFEANSTYDDPYLPGFSVKPGDRFRYVKIVVDTSDRRERLACRTENGDLVCLSSRCKGNFTVLKDRRTYTLRQLVDLAQVPRRLKLAPDENQDVKESAAAESNKDSSASSSTQVPDIPLDFTGVVLMSRPREELEVFPLGNPETKWIIPLDANLHVRPFSASDYEEPVKSRRVKSEPLKSFVSEHEHKFPVHATLFAYPSPPAAISECITDTRDVIIHRCNHTHKIFAKDSTKDEYFAIDSSVDISFVEIPRTLKSIFEMMALPLGTEVQVLADVAADFPEPFVLRYGDILRVTKHDSSSWKFKHSSTGDVPIIKCERVVKGGKPEKLKLPLDLEISLVLLVDPSQLSVTKAADIFSGKASIPIGNVSVLEGHGGSFAPLPASFQILQILTDKELVVSPLHTTTAISPRIKICIKIPLRHEVNLGLKRKLEFPDGYFIMPSKHHVVTVGIERVAERDYEEICQASKLAVEYEDVEFGPSRGESDDDTRSQASSSARSSQTVGSSSNIRNATSADSLDRKRHRRKDRIKRISQVLLNPRQWRHHPHQQATEKEETTATLPPPLPPVSGILTLSLQPHKASDNHYILDVEPPNHQAPASQDEYFEDDPYEDVTISPEPQLAQRSTSMQLEKSQLLMRPADLPTSLSASDNDVNRLVAGGDCETPQRQRNKSKVKESEDRSPGSPEESGSSHPRQRQARGDDSEDGRNRRRRNEPRADVLEEREKPRDRLSPSSGRPSGRERSDKGEPTEEDLERAPHIRHTRTRSPVLPRAELEKHPPDEGKEKSRRRRRGDSDLKHEDSVSSGFSRSFDSETQRNACSPNGHSENVRAPERRRRKVHSPDDPSQSSERVGTPERQRRKLQSPDYPSQSPETVGTPERRRRKTQSPPDDPSQSPENVGTPERRRRKMQSPDSCAQSLEKVSPPERQRRKPLSPDDPSPRSENVSLEERHRRRRDRDSPAEVSTKSSESRTESESSNSIKEKAAVQSSQPEPRSERSPNSHSSHSRSERSQHKHGDHRSHDKVTDDFQSEQRKDSVSPTKQNSWMPDKWKHVEPPGRQRKHHASSASESSAKGDSTQSPEKSTDAEPMRPRRRNKAQEDTSAEKPGDLSVSSTGSSSKVVDGSHSQDDQKSSLKTSESKNLQGKPALPPKPVIFAQPGGSKPPKPIKLTQPVAPPRRKEAKETKTTPAIIGMETQI